MKYYRNELGQVVSVEDKIWKIWEKIEPRMMTMEITEAEANFKEEAPDPEIEQVIEPKGFNKLEDESAGIRSERTTTKGSSTGGDSAVSLGEVKQNPNRKKKVQNSEGAKKGRPAKKSN